MDYVRRMKLTANLSWFLIETLPVAPAETSLGKRIAELVRRLSAVGADFDAEDPKHFVRPADRFAARLEIDALVALLYGLHPDELAHIASRFPIYDDDVPIASRYCPSALNVFRSAHADGPDAARRRAAELSAARATAGVGFGFDELWQPPGGWDRANAEAREILAVGASI